MTADARRKKRRRKQKQLEQRRERERTQGINPNDAAARWLRENDPEAA